MLSNSRGREVTGGQLQVSGGLDESMHGWKLPSSCRGGMPARQRRAVGVNEGEKGGCRVREQASARGTAAANMGGPILHRNNASRQQTTQRLGLSASAQLVRPD